MRILCTTPPMEGLIGPLLPLAHALRAGGHDVLVATGADGLPRLATAGLPSVEVGPAAMASAIAALADPAVAGSDVGGADHWRFGGALFGSAIPAARLPALRVAALRFRPDLLLHNLLDLAAPLVAAERGIPAVSYGAGLVPDERLLADLESRVAPLWREAGLPFGNDNDNANDNDFEKGARLFRQPYLDPCPSSLQPDLGVATPVACPVRPVVPGRADEALPAWVERVHARPLVYVSLGTVPLFNQPSTFAALLGGLSDGDGNGDGDVEVEVVVTVGELQDPQALGPQPPHVHVERWLSLAALLPRCAAVVCHGGAGTTLAALACGLPVVLAPQGADQHAMAAACERAGLARVLPPAPTPSVVADAVRSVLADGPERAAAGAVAREIAGMPSPESAATHAIELGFAGR